MIALVPIQQPIAHRAYHDAVPAIIVQMRIQHHNVARGVDARLIVGARNLDSGLVIVPRFDARDHQGVHNAILRRLQLVIAAARIDSGPAPIAHQETLQPDVPHRASLAAIRIILRAQSQHMHHRAHVLIGILIRILSLVVVRIEVLRRLAVLRQLQVADDPILNVLQ